MKKPEKGMTLSKKVLMVVTDYFLTSKDFNGIPIETLQTKINRDWFSIRRIIKDLVENELVGVIDQDTDINPHIIRRGFGPISYQTEKLEKDSTNGLCLYPRPKHLINVVDRSKYDREPYKLLLALGDVQLSYRSFDLSVLEFYRNDPRYIYGNDDIRGHISYISDDLHDRDQILLQSFGFSYNDSFDRAVAVFLCYLNDLTPDHQLIWQTKEIDGDYKLHPAYYRNMVIGEWDDKVPIFSAILEEFYIINRMCEAMEKPQLFIDDFGKYGERRPKQFGFLIRPTLNEFHAFVSLLDKMLSENINKSFFLNQVSYETETIRQDGKIIVVQKGTLKLLDEWVRKYFRTSDWDFWDKTMNTLKKVRRLRQKPAHNINEDEFDQKYFKMQRELIIDVYMAVRDIRLLFANHPRVIRAKIQIPEWLDQGKIWDR